MKRRNYRIYNKIHCAILKIIDTLMIMSAMIGMSAFDGSPFWICLLLIGIPMIWTLLRAHAEGYFDK